MILEAGVESVSVRKVADRAGYSLGGTVYNHFDNLDALLWQTRELMIMDVAIYMKEQDQGIINNLNGVKKVFSNFMKYFIKNQYVYRFFYNHSLSHDEKPLTSVVDNPEIRGQFGNAFGFLLEDGGALSVDALAYRSKMIVYTMFGMMTLYIAGNDDLDLALLYKELDEFVEVMLGN